MQTRDPRAPGTARRRPSRQAGFTLIEILIAAVVLAVGLLGHMASTMFEHRMVEDQRTRSTALSTARQFMERMRADEDWETLYARMRTLQDGSGAADLYPPTAYDPDFRLPEVMESMRVLVTVPSAIDVGPSALGAEVLREDVTSVRMGLPSDLNGDGIIDSDPRDDDYTALPIIVRFRWTPRAEDTRELVFHTWLRGMR